MDSGLAPGNDDPRADILSLGRILHEMLVGTPTFDGPALRKQHRIRGADRYVRAELSIARPMNPASTDAGFQFLDSAQTE